MARRYLKKRANGTFDIVGLSRDQVEQLKTLIGATTGPDDALDEPFSDLYDEFGSQTRYEIKVEPRVREYKSGFVDGLILIKPRES